MSDSLAEAIEAAASALVERGATRREIRIDAFRKALPMWAAAMGEAAETSFGTLLGGGEEIGLFWEWMRWWGGRSDHTFPALGLVAIERVEAFIERMGDFSEGMLQLAQQTRDELDETLGASGVLLYPPHWTTAPRHNRSLWLPIRWMHTALFNVLHCPVTQVPTGLDSQGLPTGVQVVGARGQDHLTIAAAVALEESLGGWQPPAQFEALEQPNPSR
jgi:fatty acid amide hydrolase 2